MARKAAAESQVLLKNTGNLLPLKKNAKIYVAGSVADNVGNQTGGWTLTWQGQSGDIPGGTSILAGIKQVAPNATVTYSEKRQRRHRRVEHRHRRCRRHAVRRGHG